MRSNRLAVMALLVLLPACTGADPLEGSGGAGGGATSGVTSTTTAGTGGGGGGPGCSDGNDLPCDGCEAGVVEEMVRFPVTGQIEVPIDALEGCVEAWISTADELETRVEGDVAFGANGGFAMGIRCSGFMQACRATWGDQSVSTHVSAGFHHVATCWRGDTHGGLNTYLYVSFGLYVDGALVGNGVFSAIGPEGESLTPSWSPRLLGYAPLDELRLSSKLRYPEPFIAQDLSYDLVRHHAPDADTLALFHFDGDLVDAAPAPASRWVDEGIHEFLPDPGYRPEYCAP